MGVTTVLRAAMASALVLVLETQSAGANGTLDALLQKPLDAAMARVVKAELPITLDDNDVLPTVDNERLPGGPFRGQTIHPTVKDLDKNVPPGDYVVPAIAFCMKYSIHEGANGTAYKLAPLQGKAAAAISALIFRGYSVQHISPEALQVVSWTIQSGTPYDSMPTDMRHVIDTVIPEYRASLNGDPIARIERSYDQFRMPGKPPLLTVLNRLGTPGQLAASALQIRATINTRATNTLIRNQTLFAGQGTTPAQPPNIRADDGPWTVIVPNLAYERAHIVGGNLGQNEVQIRVLPQRTMHRALTARRRGPERVALLPLVIPLAMFFLEEAAEAAAVEESGVAVAAITRQAIGLLRLAAPTVQAQTLLMAMTPSPESGNGTRATPKPDSGAGKKYRDEPQQFDGRTPEDVEAELDETLVTKGHWTKAPLGRGDGVRYYDDKGNLISINAGYPRGMPGGDVIHRGPYVKIEPGGFRRPLAGNPALQR